MTADTSQTVSGAETAVSDAREIDLATGPDVPAIAHRGRRGNPRAFCGARIVGVPAPAGYPYVCERCTHLHDQLRQHVEKLFEQLRDRPAATLNVTKQAPRLHEVESNPCRASSDTHRSAAGGTDVGV